MAILDTFYLLFKSDTKDLKKGADEAERTVNHLNDSLNKAGRSSEHLGDSFLKMAHSAAKLLAAAVPVAFFTSGIKGAIDLGTELAKTSRVMNLNIEDLQAWGNAVEVAGGDAKQFQSTLESMSERFGVTNQQALSLLPRYANLLSKLSPARAQRIGKMLGLDEGTILLLQQGTREVDNMVRKQKQLNVITEQNKELYLKYDRTIVGVKQSFNGLFAALAIEVLPLLIKLAEKTQEWMLFFIKHKDFVIGGFYAIAGAVTALSIRFAAMNPVITLISGLILGLITLFAAVYDDIQAFMKGQRSLIGYFINHYPAAAQAVYDAFKIIREAFHLLEKAAWHLMHPLQTVEAALNKIADLMKSTQNYLSNKLGIDLKTTNTNILDEKIKAVLNTNPNAAGSKANSVSVNTGDITIQTQATDAKGISSAITSEIQNQIANVSNFHADGVTS